MKATPRFVRRLVAERRIAFVKVGRLVRFEASAVAAYIETNRGMSMTRHSYMTTGGMWPDGG